MTFFAPRTRSLFRAPVIAGAMGLAAGGWASGARAAPGEKTPAERLDAEGTTLMHQRRYVEACPKLAESARLEPGTGVLLRLGLCDEELGKTASAWSAFREAAVRAEHAGDEALRQLAAKRADEIEPRVPQVRFVAPPGALDLALACDGARFDAALSGAPIPLDPGPHSVELVRGGAVIRRAFVLGERDRLVTIALAPPVAAAEGAPPMEPAAGTGRLPAQRVAALVLGGVGVAGLAIGGILGRVALMSWNQARSECDRGYTGCSADALDRQSSIRTEATGSTIGFVVGAAAIAGAAVLWWTSPRRGTKVGLTVSGAGGGVALTGSF